MARPLFLLLRLCVVLFSTRTCLAFHSPIASPIARCGPAVGLCSRPAALSLKRIGIRGVKMAAASKSWGTREWNWGYASGGAHDAAAVLRARLSKGEAREEWLGEMMAGESIPWEEVKLCLALKWQRAARERRDGGPGGYADVLDTLVAGKYEDAEDGDPAMTSDMARRLHLVTDVPRLSAMMGDSMYPSGSSDINDAAQDIAKLPGNDAKRMAAACVLQAMDFVQFGL